MIGFLCLLFPPLLLIIIREKKVKNNNRITYNVLIHYAVSAILLNVVMIVILRVFFHNSGYLFLKLNSYYGFAAKYFSLSVVLAIAGPYLEKIGGEVKLAFINLPESGRIKKIHGYLRAGIFFRIVCVVELVIFVWALGQCLRSPCNLEFQTEALISSNISDDCTVDLKEDSDDGSYYTVSKEENIGATSILETDTFKLYPGSYEVKIKYRSDVASDDGDSVANSTGNLILSSAHHGVYFNFNSLSLRDAYTEEVQTVQLTSPVAVDDFTMTVNFTGNGTLSVYAIEINEVVIYKYVLLVLIVVMSFLIDFVIVKFISGVFGKTEGIMLLICLTAILPFIADYSFSGHDTNFHLNRIVCLADEIKMGNYFPAIYSTALNNYGYATPIFYGPLFLYIPAILYCCGFSLTFVYNLYMIIFAVATCFIMYFVAFRIFNRKMSALIAAALYTLSAVRLTNVLTRAALGEFTAQTFLPLIVLGFYYIYTAEEDEHIPLQKYFPIVIGLSGVILSHTLTTIMCGVLIIVFCLVAARNTFKFKRFIALAKACLLTLLVNLSTLVPFFDSYMSGDFAISEEVNYIQASGVYPLQLFNLIVDNFQKGSVKNTASNEMSFNIGGSLTLGLIFFCVYLLSRSSIAKKNERVEKLFPFSKVCCGFMCGTLFLSTIFMPYDILDSLPDIIYSFLTAYQFTWRWLVFATLFGVFLTTYAIEAADVYIVKNRLPYISLIVIGTVLALNTSQIYADQLETSTLSRFSNNSYTYNMNCSGNHYLLIGTDTSKYNYSTLSYDASQVDVADYERTAKGAEFLVYNWSDSDQSVTLPIVCYDNYYAYDDSEQLIHLEVGENGQITVSIPAGYSGTVRIVYSMRLTWKISIGISVIISVLLLSYGFWCHTKNGGKRLIKQRIAKISLAIPTALRELQAFHFIKVDRYKNFTL